MTSSRGVSKFLRVACSSSYTSVLFVRIEIMTLLSRVIAFSILSLTSSIRPLARVVGVDRRASIGSNAVASKVALITSTTLVAFDLSTIVARNCSRDSSRRS